MKTRILLTLLCTLAVCNTVFPSGTTIGNGLTTNSAKKEKVCLVDGKEVKRPIDDKCEEVKPKEEGKKEETPAQAPKK